METAAQIRRMALGLHTCEATLWNVPSLPLYQLLCDFAGVEITWFQGRHIKTPDWDLSHPPSGCGETRVLTGSHARLLQEGGHVHHAQLGASFNNCFVLNAGHMKKGLTGFRHMKPCLNLAKHFFFSIEAASLNTSRAVCSSRTI